MSLLEPTFNRSPPRRDKGSSTKLRGVQGLKKVDEYGALDRGELVVPANVNREIAFQNNAVVILENQQLLLNKSQHPQGGGGGVYKGVEQVKIINLVTVRAGTATNPFNSDFF
uniref:Uncharacterized protein n=1 Tax=Nelumbo nucifera TaxID=4432 RepID=A0A822YPZ2_NELNU|nr:TPA_asm: hypothetical protein HUJ06_011747 [Nelumbo nucifera]